MQQIVWSTQSDCGPCWLHATEGKHSPPEASHWSPVPPPPPPPPPPGSLSMQHIVPEKQSTCEPDALHTLAGRHSPPEASHCSPVPPSPGIVVAGIFVVTGKLVVIAIVVIWKEVVTICVVAGNVVAGIVVERTVVTGVVVERMVVPGALVEEFAMVVGADVVTGAVVDPLWLVLVGEDPGSLGLRKQNSVLPSKSQSLHTQFWFFAFFWPHAVPSGQASHVVLDGMIGSR
jgi:hypothetical protein